MWLICIKNRLISSICMLLVLSGSWCQVDHTLFRPAHTALAWLWLSTISLSITDQIFPVIWAVEFSEVFIFLGSENLLWLLIFWFRLRKFFFQVGGLLSVLNCWILGQFKIIYLGKDLSTRDHQEQAWQNQIYWLIVRELHSLGTIEGLWIRGRREVSFLSFGLLLKNSEEGLKEARINSGLVAPSEADWEKWGLTRDRVLSWNRAV